MYCKRCTAKTSNPLEKLPILATTIDGFAQKLAKGFHNSKTHWSYIGTYNYISLGLTLKDAGWYCCIIMANVDLYENPSGF
jgi:hypothetical protein